MRTAQEIKSEYMRWLSKASDDEDLINELTYMNADVIEEAFYRDLTFGTGGLRGIIGAGTNRMNIYTVSKASQGLANHIKKQFCHKPSMAIAYDSRIKSDIFSKVAAGVFAANGIKVYIYSELMPTPCLSYAVRTLDCSAGIVITASHNSSEYNGYKVYGSDGCQITTELAASIFAEIEELDVFDGIKSVPFKKALDSGMVEYIDPNVYNEFIREVKNQSVLFGDEIDRNVAIVYSPLNGAGLKPARDILLETGFTNITVVDEQSQPDGNFPTCPYPNPEIQEAMELGLQYCDKTGADLLLATDPDADRCGIAVRDEDGYKLLSGNEIGLLLLDYICSQRKKHNKMPKRPMFIKTIVTTALSEKIADSYGIETIDVLTGFKFIGEAIGRLESEGRESDFICGFEESYGYLTGTYVRDKDAVNAVLMICEMFSFYKTQGIKLTKKLEDIYNMHGYCMNTLYSYSFEGSSGTLKMQGIMEELRSGLDEIGGFKITEVLDYDKGIQGLPKSDVIKFMLEEGSSVIVRPSGTEPKIKIYISVIADNKAEAREKERRIRKLFRLRD